MIRSARLTFVLSLLVLAPVAASAQKDSKYTKDANKHLGLAMASPTPEMKDSNYRKALVILREGMVKDAENAKVWLMSGTVLAAVCEGDEAITSFDKALQLHPAYAAEVAIEKETAWFQLFNCGLTSMDAQKLPEATKLLESAELLYSGRPEALINLGVLYANAGDRPKAIKAFTDAVAATRGPLLEKQDSVMKAEWIRFRDVSRVNIAQIHAATGLAAFEKNAFDEAAEAFKAASETNPWGRDHIFNYAQAIWGNALKLSDGMAGKPADAQVTAKLNTLYADLERVAGQALQLDPNNEALHELAYESHRRRRDLTADSAAKMRFQTAALKELEAHGALKVMLDEVQVEPRETGQAVKGVLKNAKATEGQDIQIAFTILGFDGKPIGEQKLTVKAPAVGQSVPFEVMVSPTGEVAGWKYILP